MKWFLIAAALCGLAPAAYAQILTDTFNRGSVMTPVALNGTAPTYSASPESWTSNSSLMTNGSEATIPASGGNQAIAYIGIPGVTTNLTVGSTYTLSFTFGSMSGDSWLAAGFGSLVNTSAVSYLGGNDSGFWALDNGGGLHIFDEVGGSISDLGNLPISNGVASVVMTITPGLTSDALSATVNGNPVPLSSSNILVDPMRQVFIGHYEAGGTYEDLVLTPEPSTWALMFGATAMLGFVLRRRAARS